MKLFQVKAGTRGLILGTRINGPEHFTTTRDLTFNDSELSVDPTRLENGGFPYPMTVGYDLAKRGYSLFNRRGRSGKQYTLCVPASDVVTLC